MVAMFCIGFSVITSFMLILMFVYIFPLFSVFSVEKFNSVLNNFIIPCIFPLLPLVFLSFSLFKVYVLGPSYDSFFFDFLGSSCLVSLSFATFTAALACFSNKKNWGVMKMSWNKSSLFLKLFLVCIVRVLPAFFLWVWYSCSLSDLVIFTYFTELFFHYMEYILDLLLNNLSCWGVVFPETAASWKKVAFKLWGVEITKEHLLLASAAIAGIPVGIGFGFLLAYIFGV